MQLVTEGKIKVPHTVEVRVLMQLMQMVYGGVIALSKFGKLNTCSDLLWQKV